MWILRGWYSYTWWTVKDTQCTIKQIKEAIKSVLYVDHVDYGTDEDAKVLGLVSKFEQCMKLKIFGNFYEALE